MRKKKAYIVGNLNCAIIFEGEKIALVRGDREEVENIDSYVLSQIYATRPELKLTSFSQQDTLRQEISKEYRKQDALHMALEIMDSRLSMEYRQKTAIALKEVIENDPSLTDFIKNRFLSTPVPESFDPNLVKGYSKELGEIAMLYSNLQEKGLLFAKFHTSIKFNLEIEPEKWIYVEQVLTDEGLYAEITTSLFNESGIGYKKAFANFEEKLKRLEVTIPEKFENRIYNELRNHYKINISDPAVGILSTPEFAKELLHVIDNFTVKEVDSKKSSPLRVAIMPSDSELAFSILISEFFLIHKPTFRWNVDNMPIFYRNIKYVHLSAKILPREKMPRLDDGNAIDVALIPSRIPKEANFLELLQTIVEWAGLIKGSILSIPIYDEAYIKEILKKKFGSKTLIVDKNLDFYHIANNLGFHENIINCYFVNLKFRKSGSARWDKFPSHPRFVQRAKEFMDVVMVETNQDLNSIAEISNSDDDYLSVVSYKGKSVPKPLKSLAKNLRAKGLSIAIQPK